MFKNFEWEDGWQCLLYATCLFLLTMFGKCTLSKKYTKAYSLGSSDGVLTIVKEIEWDVNDVIKLDRSVTYWDAIRMVDSLNATIKKLPSSYLNHLK